jgi:hypothetical protein
MQIMRRGGMVLNESSEPSAKRLSPGSASEMPVERRKVRRRIFMIVFF